ncbi:MAG TPA: hypothetical protein VI248_11755 [Kineosporiaceae bacterium]
MGNPAKNQPEVETEHLTEHQLSAIVGGAFVAQTSIGSWVG